MKYENEELITGLAGFVLVHLTSTPTTVACLSDKLCRLVELGILEISTESFAETISELVLGGALQIHGNQLWRTRVGETFLAISLEESGH